MLALVEILEVVEGKPETNVERRRGFLDASCVGEAAGEGAPGLATRDRQRESLTDASQSVVRSGEGQREGVVEGALRRRLVGAQVDGETGLRQCEQPISQRRGGRSKPHAAEGVDFDGRSALVVALELVESPGRRSSSSAQLPCRSAELPYHGDLVLTVGRGGLLELCELPVELAPALCRLEQPAPAVAGRRGLGENLVDDRQAVSPLLAAKMILGALQA